MHEAPGVKELVRKIEAIARQHGGPKILGVKVRLGALTGLSPEAFKEHFKHASLGTVAKGAALLVVVNDDMRDPLAREVVLESLEVEDILPQTIYPQGIDQQSDGNHAPFLPGEQEGTRWTP